MADEQRHVFQIKGQSKNILPSVFEAGASLCESILRKQVLPNPGGDSQQGVDVGIKGHPFDMSRAADTMTANIHHARCIHAKVRSHVGLGHKSDKVSKALNPLTMSTWWQVLCDVAMDYHLLGQGYLEVVRDDGGRIAGLHHIPAGDIHLWVESAKDYHYVVNGEGHHIDSVFARFGDLEGLRSREGEIQRFGGQTPGQDKMAEVIPFSMPTSLSRWYGIPDWVAAITPIEVVAMLHQHTHDFFLNRGVPEFLLFVLGRTVPKEQWDKIEETLQSHVGLTNSHKSSAINLPGEVTVQLEKLAMEGRSDATTFSSMSDTLATEIVSAHGVPPLLAGIQIPGKLGANNELPNALMAFQALCIGQAQKHFTETLGKTLGDPALGVQGLSAGDFDFNTILDEIDLGMADTVGRMRQSVPEARAEGRDLQGGMKD